MNNNDLRKQFNDWHKAAYEPPLTNLAKEIGINRPELSNWKHGNLDFGTKRLSKIKNFLIGEINNG